MFRDPHNQVQLRQEPIFECNYPIRERLSTDFHREICIEFLPQFQNDVAI